MTRKILTKLGSLTLGVTLVAVSGCQHDGQGTTLALLNPVPERITTGAKETADLQIAAGRSLEKEGKVDRAIATYREAVKRDPKRADAYQRLAVLSDRKGQREDADKYFKKALEISPGNPDLFCDRGYSMYLQHRWEEARMNLKQALALDSTHQRSHVNLGLVLAHSEQPEEALAEFRKGGCDEATAYANLAFTQTLGHRWDDAKGSYQRALAANASCERAKNGLSELNKIMVKVQDPVTKAPPTSLAAAPMKAPPAPARKQERVEVTSDHGKAVTQQPASITSLPRDMSLSQPASAEVVKASWEKGVPAEAAPSDAASIDPLPAPPKPAPRMTVDIQHMQSRPVSPESIKKIAVEQIPEPVPAKAKTPDRANLARVLSEAKVKEEPKSVQTPPRIEPTPRPVAREWTQPTAVETPSRLKPSSAATITAAQAQAKPTEEAPAQQPTTNKSRPKIKVVGTGSSEDETFLTHEIEITTPKATENDVSWKSTTSHSKP